MTTSNIGSLYNDCDMILAALLLKHNICWLLVAWNVLNPLLLKVNTVYATAVNKFVVGLDSYVVKNNVLMSQNESGLEK